MGNQIVKVCSVEITEILPTGLRVQLLSGDKIKKGFIRKREISWDRRINAVLPVFHAGQTVDAVLLDDSNPNNLSLSIRQLTDPWENAQKSYKVGQIILGEVVDVQHNEVRIQVEPGIEAKLEAKNAPLLSKQSLVDILSLGDKVAARIMKINDHQHPMSASLNHLLVDLEAKKIDLKDFIKEQFGADKHPRAIEKENTGAAASDLRQPAASFRLDRLGRILLIDNEDNHLKEIKHALSEEFSVPVDTARNEKEALAKIHNELDYTLVLIDYWLDNITGDEVSKRILKFKPTQKILIISSAFPGIEVVEEFRTLGMFFCKKEIDEIINKIYELRDGTLQTSTFKPEQDEKFLNRSGMKALAQRETEEVLQEILARLIQQTGVDHCFLLKTDRNKHSVVIIASEPNLTPEEKEVYQDNLYLSPVRQLAEEEELEFCEDHVDVQYDPKYKNFFFDLEFHSCFGIPIQIPDQRTHFILFLLDNNPVGLSKNEEHGLKRIEQARTSADMLSVTLQRDSLLTFMKKYQARYAMGQLLGDLIHEAKHKLDALQNDHEELKQTFKTPPHWEDAQEVQNWWTALSAHVERIDEDKQEIKALLDSYDRQSQYKYEEVDVNQIVEKIAVQLSKTAIRLKGSIQLDLCQDIPHAIGIALQIEQIVHNLTLNALQMINISIDHLSQANKERQIPLPFPQNGIVCIQTRWNPENTSAPIEIRVIDSGPGVHWNEQEDIFLGEFSRRGGGGRGLSVSRTLAEQMGGHLKLLNSVMFIGTAFLLELRCFPERN